MKTVLTTLLLILTATILQAQTEKTISISDMRKSGSVRSQHITGYVDTSTAGRHAGDLFVNRFLTLNFLNEKEDSITTYDIHCVKPFKNELRNYSVIIYEKRDFDKASYTWLTDSVVSVTFINSATNMKRRLKLAQPPAEEGCCWMNLEEGSAKDED